MSDRAPFHPLYHIILPEFLLVFALACNPPQRWRVLLFLGFCYATGLALQSTTGDILQDYTLGTFITAQWFTALRLLLLADPLSEYRHVADDIHPTQYGLLYRGYWCACVIHSVCGLGWDFQASIPVLFAEKESFAYAVSLADAPYLQTSEFGVPSVEVCAVTIDTRSLVYPTSGCRAVVYGVQSERVQTCGCGIGGVARVLAQVSKHTIHRSA